MSYKLGILGVGKMGGAILDGVVSSKIYDKKDIYLYTPDEEIKNKYMNLGFSFARNEKDLFINSNIILIAIKPQVFGEALVYAKDIDFSGRGVLSIAAGKKIAELEAYFKNATITRAMPNLPASIRCGAITVCANRYDSLFDESYRILSSVGSVSRIEENQMDETLPLNGSMPAYAYLFAKAFIDYAVKNNIDYNVALDLTCNSIKGSMDMILKSKDTSIDTLIKNVCSKGGTTIEGLNKLYDNSFEEIIYKCAQACTDRSKELSK